MTNDELTQVKAERDTAWKELRDIREVIQADNNESTLDSVTALTVKYDKLTDRVTVLELRNRRDLQRLDQERSARMYCEKLLAQLQVAALKAGIIKADPKCDAEHVVLEVLRIFKENNF